jgi:alpha-1,2-mannosyltransferase
VVVGAASVVISPVSWTHHQIWLVLAAFLPVGRERGTNLVWALLVLFVMLVPVTSLGGDLPGMLGVGARELRLILALAVACFVPLAVEARVTAGRRA